MEKISVVVPVYNTSKYLKRCIDSLLVQNEIDLQIICVNDASTDDSLQILESYNDKRVEIYNNYINRGAGYSKNYGLSKCRGEYICIVDSDDWLKDGALNEIYNVAISQDSDIVYYGMELINELNNSCYLQDFMGNTKELYTNFESGLCFLEELIKNHKFSSGSRNFFRRDLLQNKEIRFTEKTLNDDVEFTLCLFSNAGKVTYYRKSIYYYFRRNQNSISNKRNTIMFWQQYIFTLNRVMETLRCKMSEELWNLVYSVLSVICLNGIWLIDGQSIFLKICGACDIKNSIFYQYLINGILLSQYYDLDNEKLKEIKTYKHIYIYGAGAYACDMYRILKTAGINIEGFIQTNAKNNKEYLKEKVYNITDISNENSNILIAVSKKYYYEILNYLITNNYKVINIIRNTI